MPVAAVMAAAGIRLDALLRVGQVEFAVTRSCQERPPFREREREHGAIRVTRVTDENTVVGECHLYALGAATA